MRARPSLVALEEMAKFMSLSKDSSIVVEVGCYAGESTEIWAKNAAKVYAIDPWDVGIDITLGEQSPRPNSIIIEAVVQRRFDERMKPYANIAKVVDYDYNVAHTFEDASLDFVYIDGLHTREAVANSIRLWNPKIKVRGWMGGHDYHPIWQGVIDAVNKAFGSRGHRFAGDSSWLHRIDK
ncbi:MAG: class I SAM-dependent methyltransferase [Candidatus Competibacteraceae bacterium]|nr:class I SAM-dependent methyltransferase [Candidatus Competibacteraceae bacterium]